MTRGINISALGNLIFQLLPYQNCAFHSLIHNYVVENPGINKHNVALSKDAKVPRVPIAFLVNHRLIELGFVFQILGEADLTCMEFKLDSGEYCQAQHK
jgi:hypothetical protein